MPRKKNAEAAPEPKPVDVNELLGQLTKKNADYVFKLRKFLKDNGADDEKEQEILGEFLPKIVEEQKSGKPANQVYGSPSVLANNLLHAPKPKQHHNFWLETLDLGLSFLAIFAVIYGAMHYFAKNASQESSGGLLSLVLMSFVASFVFNYYNRWTLMDKEKRPNLFLIIIAGMAIIVVVSIVSTWLTSVNTIVTAPLPPIGQFIVAAAAYAGHFFLKRIYHLPNLFQAATKD
ncbi:DUF1129 domain-containing protein [Lacticaseibacillus zhaodongensis]|uniref:DUF1129 domain-containing protein n=1 Tax=Lacticaseibacillus zhaodongensis TaxID=2668065 RepID=UPI0012D31B83|nr:DUF1129 family protein [Lacticaseibacillus zhaodongensis]